MLSNTGPGMTWASLLCSLQLRRLLRFTLVSDHTQFSRREQVLSTGMAPVTMPINDGTGFLSAELGWKKLENLNSTGGIAAMRLFPLQFCRTLSSNVTMDPHLTSPGFLGVFHCNYIFYVNYCFYGFLQHFLEIFYRTYLNVR